MNLGQKMYVIQQKQCKKGLCICLCCVLLESCLCIATHPARAEDVQSSASVTPPQLQTDIQPIYPQNAPQKQEKIQVRVLLEINEQGHVTRASFVEGPQELKEASLNAATQLVFSPALQDGVPVSTETTFTLTFSPAPDEALPDDNVKEITNKTDEGTSSSVIDLCIGNVIEVCFNNCDNKSYLSYFNYDR